MPPKIANPNPRCILDSTLLLPQTPNLKGPKIQNTAPRPPAGGLSLNDAPVDGAAAPDSAAYYGAPGLELPVLRAAV